MALSPNTVTLEVEASTCRGRGYTTQSITRGLVCTWEEFSANSAATHEVLTWQSVLFNQSTVGHDLNY